MSDLSFEKIKGMSTRERNKLRSEDLINLILTTDLASGSDINVQNLNKSIDVLNDTLKDIRAEIRTNSEKIVQLTTDNAILMQMNKNSQQELLTLKTQMDRTEQYLRINNVEIAGLEKSSKEKSDEDIALKFFNEILECPVKNNDIDICHAIPSSRKDNKNVVVCRFLSRKTKIEVLSAKDKLREFNKHNEDNTILLYEHLSPENRVLYAKAAKYKFENEFKFLWTKNGFPFLRKDENSRVVKIKSLSDLEKIDA